MVTPSYKYVCRLSIHEKHLFHQIVLILFERSPILNPLESESSHLKMEYLYGNDIATLLSN